ncbi:uncharacterized protein LOC143035517 [Oratosquilla oratoria]|uniref:uncharacterized protein LOC143035517 n=1 Tax=Oratosquilla oratoria TaxID=337810 RepID=UPI003F75FF64
MRPQIRGTLQSALWLLSLKITWVEAKEEAKVRVFSLQKDLWEPPSIDPFLAFDLSVENQAEVLTLCYRYRLYRKMDLDTFISIGTATKFDYVTIAHYGDIFYPCFKEKCSIFVEPWGVKHALGRWYSECVIVTKDNSIQMYRDGQDLGIKMFGSSYNEPFILNGTLVIGQEQDVAKGGFNPFQSLSGDITEVNIWDVKLAEESIIGFQLCLQKLHGNLFSSDHDNVELNNVEENIWVQSDLCRKDLKFIVLPIVSNKLEEAIQICHLFNLTHFVPTSAEANEALLTMTTKFHDQCWENSAYLWIAGFDPEGDGIWRHTEDRRTLKYSNFYKGYRDSGEPRCLTFLRDGTWYNTLCKRAKPLCTSCERGPYHFLYLRGFCEKSEFHTRYQVEGYINQRPYFKGVFARMIYWSQEETWVLYDVVANQTIATMISLLLVDYPVGRHQWRLEKQVCDEIAGAEINLSLSLCTKDQFMCASGNCIPKHKRCNSHDDCTDSSDEEECQLVTFGKKYQSNQPAPSNTTNHPLLPGVAIKILRFSKVDDKDMNLNIDFIVTLSWFEPRVEYMNLRKQNFDNVLLEKHRDRFWTPRLSFRNVYNGLIKLNAEEMSVVPQGPAKPYSFTHESLDSFYPGSSGKLLHERNYIGTFSCNFQLWKYPFDEQQCSIDAFFASVSRKLVNLDKTSLTVRYSGDSMISNYILKDFQVKSSPWGPHAGIRVSFTLERRFSLVLVSTFMPCLFLLFIAYASLFIRLELFMPRVMVSLTTLLVFYTLFNQVSSVLPSTAYIKVIDLWFFMCMSLLFFIIITHVVVDNLPLVDDIQVFKKDEKDNRLTANRLIYLARVFVLPILMISIAITIIILYSIF